MTEDELDRLRRENHDLREEVERLSGERRQSDRFDGRVQMLAALGARLTQASERESSSLAIAALGEIFQVHGAVTLRRLESTAAPAAPRWATTSGSGLTHFDCPEALCSELDRVRGPVLVHGDEAEQLGLPGVLEHGGGPACEHFALIPIRPGNALAAALVLGWSATTMNLALEELEEEHLPYLAAVAALLECTLCTARRGVADCLDPGQPCSQAECASVASRQKNKMEALGYLAEGVAHDFNNLLTVIVGSASLLESTAAGEELDELTDAATRASALVDQLLSYGSDNANGANAGDVNEVAHSFTSMLRRLIGMNIELELRLTPGLDAVGAEQNQIEQILMNLAVNARDAMPSGGRIIVSTAPSSIVDQGRALAAVRLSVSDTGEGIPEEIRHRLFEPFFTTKEKGEGQGMGLATVFAIVEGAGGQIHVESELGRGTQFDILFPVARQSTVRGAPVGEAPLVLVLDDERGVRRVCARLLERAGFHVLSAANVDEARELCVAHGDRLDLIVSDVVLPGTSGPDFAREVRRLRPDLPFLFMSGYRFDEATLRGIEPPVGQMTKPFSGSEFLGRATTLLKNTPGGGPLPQLALDRRNGRASGE